MILIYHFNQIHFESIVAIGAIVERMVQMFGRCFRLNVWSEDNNFNSQLFPHAPVLLKDKQL